MPEAVLKTEFLIVSLTPQNLERGALWYSKNLQSIKRARSANPWWRDNSLILEKDLTIKPSALLRRLSEMGYERSQTVRGKGLLAARGGGIIEIWPVNSEKPYLIEFSGNSIATIQERKEKPINVELQHHRSPTLCHDIEKLPLGSYVVHADHGIGIFRGIQKICDRIFFEQPAEKETYIVIEYAAPRPCAESDRLFIPIVQKDRLTPYIGFEAPKIHRLGGTLWSKTKRQVTEDVEKLARELLALYAKREVAARAPYEPDEMLLQELRSAFVYKETPDQLRAEEEILRDLSREKPMDRILCGDVGFGKTEVAIRAALAAISSGKQVALLSPTTILAAQHEKTFQERLASLPITVSLLSRLTQQRDITRILHEVEEGRLDCLIGTHRLLGKDVVFKNLGLVIIDEEQRFGVKQKEHFKNLRSAVDILSLSATPIPRTLSLALAKLRDISVIETPPPERLPIKTHVLPYGIRIIREAIRQELSRGGQVYFLHNRIETLAFVKEKLLNYLLLYAYDRKDIRVTIGVLHGRMREREIVKMMERFRNKEVNILLATTIIENGLDISSANMLIVDDATRLGLAEAHQLRGRIGRGATQAYAYFLYRPHRLTEKAVERLEALQEYAELGAGYELALRDLEIRGAGNILGKKQSGAINKVGLNLYYQMLTEAVESMK